jgi:hypothetical protein
MNPVKRASEKKRTTGGDKRTIGITSSNERALAALIQAGNFGAELDAAKFAMAHAINHGIEAGSADGANTKWNVGTVDPDGSLRALVESLYSDATEPYRLIEHLINEGLKLLQSADSAPPDVVGLLIKAGATTTATDGAETNH